MQVSENPNIRMLQGDCMKVGNICLCNGDWINNSLPDKSIDLIIADPPYFETKGSFDFVWDNFNEYLQDVEIWAKECKRLLKERGTLYWFGSTRNIAYSQIIFDKYFGLLNNLVWEKAEDDGLFGSTGSDQLRRFPTSTERILMYSNDKYNLTQCVYNIRDYIRSEIKRAKGKIVLKDVNKALGVATNGGGVASACLSLNKSNPSMITEEMYGKLRKWLNSGTDDYLRKEYEELRRPFNNITESTEVIKVRFNPSNYNHDTVKPERLIRILINTSSRKDDHILVPFMGSGTTPIMSRKENRKCTAFEIKRSHYNDAVERFKEHEKQGQLFSPEEQYQQPKQMELQPEPK